MLKKRIFALFLALCLATMSLISVSAKPLDSAPILPSYDKQALLSALYEGDISSMREALSMGLITSRELTAYYLERIEVYNKTFNCFITLCDNALAVAEQRDKAIADGTAKGSLYGIPVMVKDNLHYEGFPTTNGKKLKNPTPSDENAAVVQYLLDEGAVIVGKTNMSTAAQEARLTRSAAVGETYNAYNIELASGGSSGGSAVGTSLNFAAASLGTDTNSSLRLPAALNGCVSLRPTTGLVERDGCIKLNGQRDTPGAITRTVYDQALMLDAITGGQYRYTENLNPNALKGIRIGVLKELSYAGKSNRTEGNLDDEIEAAFKAAITEFEVCGAEVVELSMSNILSLSDACSESNDNHLSAKKTFYSKYEKLLKDNGVSAVIFPTFVTAPLYTGYTKEGGLKVYQQLMISNCRTISPSLGVPEITVPLGMHSRGCSFGLEIAALKNEEQLLLDIAYAYTAQYDHRVVPTTAPNLYAAHGTKPLAEFMADYKAEYERLNTPTTTTTTPSSEAVGNRPQSPLLPIDWLPLVLILGGVSIGVTVAVIVIVKIYRRPKGLHRR